MGESVSTVRNRQNFVVGSYFPTARKSRKNSSTSDFPGKLLVVGNLQQLAGPEVTNRYRLKTRLEA
jgi:hypothetical protein